MIKTKTRLTEYWLAMSEDKFYTLIELYESALQSCSSIRRAQLRYAKIPIPRKLLERLELSFEESLRDYELMLDLFEQKHSERDHDRLMYLMMQLQNQSFTTYGRALQILQRKSVKDSFIKRLKELPLNSQEPLELNRFHLHAKEIRNQIRITTTYLLQVRRGYIRLFDLLIREIEESNPLQRIIHM